MRLGGLQGIWENLYVIWSVTPRASKDLMFDHGNGSEMNKACIQCVFISTLLFCSCSNHMECELQTILVCLAYRVLNMSMGDFQKLCVVSKRVLAVLQNAETW